MQHPPEIGTDINPSFIEKEAGVSEVKRLAKVTVAG